MFLGFWLWGDGGLWWGWVFEGGGEGCCWVGGRLVREFCFVCCGWVGGRWGICVDVLDLFLCKRGVGVGGVVWVVFGVVVVCGGGCTGWGGAVFGWGGVCGFGVSEGALCGVGGGGGGLR